MKDKILVYRLCITFWMAMALSACNIPTPQPTVTSTPAPDPVELGREVFVLTCAQCHGDKGQGYANDLAAPALDASEHAWHHPDQQICEWIINGKLGLGRQMPALGDQLSKEEISAVIAYLHTLWTGEQLAQQQDVTSRWEATPSPQCGF